MTIKKASCKTSNFQGLKSKNKYMDNTNFHDKNIVYLYIEVNSKVQFIFIKFMVSKSLRSLWFECKWDNMNHTCLHSRLLGGSF